MRRFGRAASLGNPAHSEKENKMKQVEIVKAGLIRRSLGVRCAAGYLRNRGWTVEAAKWVLFRR